MLNPFAPSPFVQTGGARNRSKTNPPEAPVETHFKLHLPGGVGSEMFQTFLTPRTQVEQQGQGGLVFSSVAANIKGWGVWRSQNAVLTSSLENNSHWKAHSKTLPMRLQDSPRRTRSGFKSGRNHTQGHLQNNFKPLVSDTVGPKTHQDFQDMTF